MADIQPHTYVPTFTIVLAGTSQDILEPTSFTITAQHLDWFHVISVVKDRNYNSSAPGLFTDLL
jgi:hypothetical protein